MLARVMVLVAGLLLVVGLGLPVAALGAGDVNEAGVRMKGRPGFGLGLPDCRAYEMVTPPEKNSASVGPVRNPDGGGRWVEPGGRERGSVRGDRKRLKYCVVGMTYYRFTRTGSGWVTTPLNPLSWACSGVSGWDDSVWGPAELACGCRGCGCVRRMVR